MVDSLLIGPLRDATTTPVVAAHCLALSGVELLLRSTQRDGHGWHQLGLVQNAFWYCALDGRLGCAMLGKHIGAPPIHQAVEVVSQAFSAEVPGDLRARTALRTFCSPNPVHTARLTFCSSATVSARCARIRCECRSRLHNCSPLTLTARHEKAATKNESYQTRNEARPEGKPRLCEYGQSRWRVGENGSTHGLLPRGRELLLLPLQSLPWLRPAWTSVQQHAHQLDYHAEVRAPVHASQNALSPC